MRKPFNSLRNIGPQQHSSNALGSVRSSSAVPMSFRWPSPKAFTSPHHRLYWRGLFRSQVVFWICCCGFCNKSVFSGAGLLAQRPTPKPGGPVGLVSEFSFSQMDCRPRLMSSIRPWFRIRVFLFLDGLPTRAIELHLPGFEISITHIFRNQADRLTK